MPGYGRPRVGTVGPPRLSSLARTLPSALQLASGGAGGGIPPLHVSLGTGRLAYCARPSGRSDSMQPLPRSYGSETSHRGQADQSCGRILEKWVGNVLAKKLTASMRSASQPGPRNLLYSIGPGRSSTTCPRTMTTPTAPARACSWPRPRSRVRDGTQTGPIARWRTPPMTKGRLAPALTCGFSGADDGIRTRDPHLGKVVRRTSAASADDTGAPLTCVFLPRHHLCSLVVSRSLTGPRRDPGAAWPADDLATRRRRYLPSGQDAGVLRSTASSRSIPLFRRQDRVDIGGQRSGVRRRLRQRRWLELAASNTTTTGHQLRVLPFGSAFETLLEETTPPPVAPEAEGRAELLRSLSRWELSKGYPCHCCLVRGTSTGADRRQVRRADRHVERDEADPRLIVERIDRELARNESL